MDLLITGANGFLGAQLTTSWLARHPDARAGCLVRGADADAARDRLRAALRGALADQAMAVDADGLLDRADAIPGDLADPSWIDAARRWLRGPATLVHCAANLSFREADRPAVWRANVDGTAALLDALGGLPGLEAFNHVSTAYVAGDRQGVVREDDPARPDRFNNAYEESKWTAEGLVRDRCAAAGVPWRVFRPSIVIAHSATHRMASRSGFYTVVDTMVQFGRDKRVAEAGGLCLPVPDGATLDLIPVDVVVREMLALLAAGPATWNRTFHLTSSEPLLLADVLRQLSPLSGVPVRVGARPNEREAVLGEVMMRRLRHYAPYFAFARRFDRAPRPGGTADDGYVLDVAALGRFVRSYMDADAANAAPP